MSLGGEVGGLLLLSLNIVQARFWVGYLFFLCLHHCILFCRALWTNYNFSFFIPVLPLWTVYKTLYFPQKVTQFKSVNDGQTTIFYNQFLSNSNADITICIITYFAAITLRHEQCCQLKWVLDTSKCGVRSWSRWWQHLRGRTAKLPRSSADISIGTVLAAAKINSWLNLLTIRISLEPFALFIFKVNLFKRRWWVTNLVRISVSHYYYVIWNNYLMNTQLLKH